jgi:hypothetical protein
MMPVICGEQKDSVPLVIRGPSTVAFRRRFTISITEVRKLTSVVDELKQGEQQPSAPAAEVKGRPYDERDVPAVRHMPVDHVAGSSVKGAKPIPRRVLSRQPIGSSMTFSGARHPPQRQPVPENFE